MPDSSGLVVLCPVDFSEPSRRALRYAHVLAARVNAALIALYVNDPLLSTAAAAAGYDERRLTSQTDRELRRFVRQTLPSGDRSEVRFDTATGDPRYSIARAARERNAGLIVMGTHGLRGARKVMLGSTTERTLRIAKVPVLAVPHAAPRKPPAAWPAGPLVAAIDLGPAARSDVSQIAALARVFDSDLLLVHVVPHVRAPFWFSLQPAGEDGDLVRARAKLARLAGDAGSQDVPVSFRVVRGEPADELARVARRAQASTLVLVLRREQGLFGMARGAVTYRALTTAATPVLAIPTGGAATRLARAWAD
jgi:universal stress protein A